MKPLHHYSEVAGRLEEALNTIGILAEILVTNGGCKGGSDADNTAQIDDRGEEGIHKAILLLAAASHRDFCRMADDMGIPE